MHDIFSGLGPVSGNGTAAAASPSPPAAGRCPAVWLGKRRTHPGQGRTASRSLSGNHFWKRERQSVLVGESGSGVDTLRHGLAFYTVRELFTLFAPAERPGDLGRSAQRLTSRTENVPAC